MRSAELLMERGLLPETEDDEYYWVDLIGLAVYSADGAYLGRLDSIFPTGSNDVYVREKRNKGNSRSRLGIGSPECGLERRDHACSAAGGVVVRFVVLTLFPELFEPFWNHGMISQGGRAWKNNG